MLIKCPKCGFAQPRDKYCAKCGIDIENQPTRREPLSERLWKNQWLQLGASLGVALVVVFSLLYVFKEEIARQITTSTVSTTGNEMKTAIQSVSDSRTLEEHFEQTLSAEVESASELKKTDRSKIKFVFGAIRKDFFRELMSEEVVDAGDARAVLIDIAEGEEILNQLSQDGELENLGSEKVLEITENPNVSSVQYLAKGSKNVFGLSFDVKVEKFANGAKVSIYGYTALPLKRGGLGKINVDMTVDLGANSGLILGNLVSDGVAPLPHALQTLFNSPLRMLASDAEKPAATELVLIIVPQ